MTWIVETLDDGVADELRAPPRDMRQRFDHFSQLIETFGLQNVHEPHVKHLEGPLWEMRLKGRDGISRAIYCHGDRAARCRGSRLRQKDADDPAQGTENRTQESKGREVMPTSRELHKEWMTDPEYAKSYAEMAPEYAVARAVIEARVLAGLTQQELAVRMETSQSAIARLESGRARPSTHTLKRLAVATGTILIISFTKPPPAL